MGHASPLRPRRMPAGFGTVANLLRQKPRQMLGNGWIGRIRQAQFLKADTALPRRQFAARHLGKKSFDQNLV